MVHFPQNCERRAVAADPEREGDGRWGFDRIPGLIAILTSAGEVEYMNREVRDYLGDSAETLEEWAVPEVIHPEDVSRVLETFANPLSSGDCCALEYRVRRFDGPYLWFQCRGLAVPNGDGSSHHWYLLLTEIEDRKRAEAKLARCEALLATGQRLSLTGTFAWRVVTDEVVWSAQVYRMFEFDQASSVTLALLEARLHPDDLSFFRESLNRVRKSGNDFEYELRLRMPNHAVKYLHVVAHGSKTDRGLEYIGAVQDVSERRVAEQTLDKARSELAHVNRVMSLGVLSASIAHEINQPLSGIVTNASTCLRMLATDPPNLDGARETARRTIHDGTRAAEVTTRLRALFTQKGVVAEPVDLNEATLEVMALSLSDLRKNQVLVRHELMSELPLVTGDRVQLQQVILNLLLNASDAMSSILDRPRHLLIQTQRDEADRVLLSVRDSGVGFEPKDANKLCEAFYSTKNTGMGIGLSVSRSIIESHGGHLWASPNQGPGATFSSSLRVRG